LLVNFTRTKAAFVNWPLAVKSGEGSSGVAVKTNMSPRIICSAVLVSGSHIKSLVFDDIVTSRLLHLFQHDGTYT
jgi:hypothetical protein